ncbi:MAG: carbamoyl-phosphate synthase large subunit, partial [Deltaproteobacteria bacterium]|nr:carbamoyl-phosphate synthase large subunit [Deltaproteobacteria bacterium]
EIEEKLRIPNSQRIFYIRYAMLAGLDTKKIHGLTKIDPWFLENMRQILDVERKIQAADKELTEDLLHQAKKTGFSDYQLGYLTGRTEDEIRSQREKAGIIPVYKLVDTCAAEFEAYTPYYYSTYEVEDESRPSERPKVMILGGGPNRIGQGIEFDYCCVHASFALREEGYESIMVNSNPETVSTDYDTSDKLYFEPLTKEDILNIIAKEKPMGVIVQFGGQTPLNLAVPLARAGVRIMGTSPDSIDRAEDRKRFQTMLQKLGLKQPPNGTATAREEALAVAQGIGYPVVIRPSYVLGGRAMRIIYDDQELEDFIESAVRASSEHPVLIDKFLEDAVEIDVDAVSDGQETIIGGIMEHIEEAGIHSGDSACVLPPHTLSPDLIDRIKKDTKAMAKELNVIGLMNVQYAIKDKDIYVLEVNPRASRTVPFVSKATGIPLAKVATKVMIGKTLRELGLTTEKEIKHIAVKEAVFPFDRFPGVDTLLGPEMRSTGEVMGIDESFGLAFAKSQLAAGQNLPLSGTVFISVRDKDKMAVVPIAQKLANIGFKTLA